MGSRISADVVNAFLGPALEVLRQYAGSEASLERMELSDELPAPPTISFCIEMRGGLAGAVYWSFDESLARRVATAMLPPGVLPDPQAPEFADAVAELANIIAGSASGALLEAGYQVDLTPPQMPLQGRFGEGLPNLIVATPAGRVRILFGVVPAAE